MDREYLPRPRRMRVLQERSRMPLVVVEVPNNDRNAFAEVREAVRQSVGQCRLLIHTDDCSITVEE